MTEEPKVPQTTTDSEIPVAGDEDSITVAPQDPTVLHDV
jgi:hypothetical protein